jgi:LysR family glycine cleavage system transcriptional activator
MALPSLRSLQIFEIAARHESFRAAADSLYLTHGAVSRQVRALEAEIGVELFSRVGKKVVLTAQGKRLQIAVAKGLKVMEDATTSLCRKRSKATKRLAITVLPSFGSRWLLPRLADFHARHPEISVDLVATLATLNMEEANVQVGIRNGGGRWSGVKSELLARDSYFPVIGKNGVLGHSNFPRTARMLLKYPLLNPGEAWERWFRRAGVIAEIPRNGTIFNDANLLFQAAENGQGIALGRTGLVADALDAGTLVRLPGPTIMAPQSYYLVFPANKPISDEAQKFAVWIREQMTVQ